MTPLEEQVEKAIEAAELALDAQMDVFLNHDNPFGFETFSPYKAAKIAIEAALAALTQPQTERCPEDCDGFGRLIGDSDGPCPACSGLESDGGGAATAAGVADALTLTPGEARNLVDAAMGDEHDPQLLDSTVKRIGDEADRQLAEPGPYAKAFRERVCPVPEFPSIRETAHEAIIEGGCCIQCGLPNNSETVLFHSCQAGAPADPTCPNTGHKFSHCDCDLGIEKEES